MSANYTLLALINHQSTIDLCNDMIENQIVMQHLTMAQSKAQSITGGSVQWGGAYWFWLIEVIFNSLDPWRFDWNFR